MEGYTKNLTIAEEREEISEKMIVFRGMMA
jgi:hypothetical protein